MIKKIILFFLCFFTAIPTYAVDINELNLAFFEKFNDEHLVYYINKAIENNHSAKQATSRVEQYRREVEYSFGKELPSLSVSANYLGIKVPQLDNFKLKKNAFVLPFTVNYEADFLLKNRDKTKSAKKSFYASLYDEKAVYISLLSDVAAVYTNILEYDNLLKLSYIDIEIYTGLLNSKIREYERGTAALTDLNNAYQNLENIKNEYEDFKKQREILLMELAVLTGISPLEINDFQRGELETFEYNGILPDEFESDVIFSRPDVMSVEALLEKAKIDVRVARKEFLPTFNITGLWVFNTIAPGTFFSWESSLAAIFAGAAQDIFSGGRKIANLKLQKAKYEEIFEKYRQTDLDAVKEVNSALCIIKQDTIVDKNTLKKLDFEYKNFNSAKQKLNRGVISNSEYLISRSNLSNIKKEAAKAKTERLIDFFTLYKAVGGKL